MLDKAKSSVVAKPVIAFVYKRLVNLVEKRQASVISTPYIRFGHRVAASGHPKDYSTNRVIVRRNLDEVQ